MTETEYKLPFNQRYNVFLNIPIADRYKKFFYPIVGRYRPSPLKRFQCYLLDEKLYPIDWEEVPPFEEYVEHENRLIKPKYSTPVYVECRCQPDMISEENIVARKIGLLFVTYRFYCFLQKYSYHFSKYIFLGSFFYNANTFNYFLAFWVWYLLSLTFADRRNQMPYNTW